MADIIQGRRDDAGAEKDSIASVRRNRLTCGGGAGMGFSFRPMRATSDCFVRLGAVNKARSGVIVAASSANPLYRFGCQAGFLNTKFINN